VKQPRDNKEMDTDTLKRIASVPHFQRSPYHDLDIDTTLDYMLKRYIEPMKSYVDIARLTLCDCGAGYGWLSFAYLINGGWRAILCDIDCDRLDAAQQIAAILGLEERCTFICSPMQDIQLPDRSVDIFASVETLEHVGDQNIDACVELMASATRRLIVLTTPNKLFPIVMHDTRVPFAHWWPPEIRKHYVRLFGKVDGVGNDFVWPWRLRPIKRYFKPVSTVLTFPSVEAWEASYPFQSPYGIKDRWRTHPPLALKIGYTLLSKLLRHHSYMLSPNLCRVWIRKEEVTQDG
jgi:2-polyprenyl-3-methyl-5-hydroxy-6-metoxy-1,4-benzoquinol methylase